MQIFYVYKSKTNTKFHYLLSETKKTNENNFITALKAKYTVLHENLEQKDLEEIRNKFNVKNVATYYQIANLFNFIGLAKLTLITLNVVSKQFVKLKTFQN